MTWHSKPLGSAFQEFRLDVQLRDFEKALKATEKLDEKKPTIAFEIMRVHELRGSFCEAISVAKPLIAQRLHRNAEYFLLFDLAVAYFECFQKGS